MKGAIFLCGSCKKEFVGKMSKKGKTLFKYSILILLLTFLGIIGLGKYGDSILIVQEHKSLIFLVHFMIFVFSFYLCKKSSKEIYFENKGKKK